MIPCDYCEQPAVVNIQRGPREDRSFACGEHRERARNAVHNARCGMDCERPLAWEGHWVDLPLPGRSRFMDENADDVESRLRATTTHGEKGGRPPKKRETR